MNTFEQHIGTARELHVQQVFEGLELLGLETRNKYRILDEGKNLIAYAAEENTGFGGAVMRQILKHWRSFSVTVYDENKKPMYKLHFPFRWFFKTLIVSKSSGQQLGRLEQRFAFFRKKFDVFDASGKQVANINSSFFKFWTFEFENHGRKLGKIQKKWSGVMSEMFTDKDNFVVTFSSGELSPEMKTVMLATTLLVDIVYFENNQSQIGVGDFFD